MGKVVFYTEDHVENLTARLRGAKQTIKTLEQLRPHWAQGYTSDSMAAQAQTSALAGLWDLLGASNQTEAVSRVKELVAQESALEAELYEAKMALELQS
ncbi:hypothetical protein [Sinorhizobium meliloti]|uniref:hypothetical protein n=1 Tax=Rhizobium meliloti TaxID=382 RepID=UPI000FD9B1C4|nr:hypothetical protein [Sinorhizobium meliloti]RVN04066.1 hypothetical protein CN112_26030 [Sinorhizobium meliloti]